MSERGKGGEEGCGGALTEVMERRVQCVAGTEEEKENERKEREEEVKDRIVHSITSRRVW
jgi:hypothetical protein